MTFVNFNFYFLRYYERTAPPELTLGAEGASISSETETLTRSATAIRARLRRT